MPPHARVAELAYAPGLGSGAARLEGSSPSSCTRMRASAPPDPSLEQGRFVRERGRRWVVQRVEREPDEDTAVRLACVDDAAGVTLEVGVGEPQRAWARASQNAEHTPAREARPSMRSVSSRPSVQASSSTRLGGTGWPSASSAWR